MLFVNLNSENTVEPAYYEHLGTNQSVQIIKFFMSFYMIKHHLGPILIMLFSTTGFTVASL